MKRAILLATMALFSTVGTAVAAPSTSRGHHGLLAGRPGGDIPDTAIYLHYQSKRFTIEYVEGWLQTATANGAVFSDKDSAVVIELRGHTSRSLSSYVQHMDLPQLSHLPGFKRGTLNTDSVAHTAALRLTFQSRSQPDAVTGKTVTLMNDRYYINGSHGLAVITLSTPQGVDNTDGFRRIAHSFRFR